MIRRTPRYAQAETLFPYKTLFRSDFIFQDRDHLRNSKGFRKSGSPTNFTAGLEKAALTAYATMHEVKIPLNPVFSPVNLQLAEYDRLEFEIQSPPQTAGINP